MRPGSKTKRLKTAVSDQVLEVRKRPSRLTKSPRPREGVVRAENGCCLPSWINEYVMCPACCLLVFVGSREKGQLAGLEGGDKEGRKKKKRDLQVADRVKADNRN